MLGFRVAGPANGKTFPGIAPTFYSFAQSPSSPGASGVPGFTLGNVDNGVQYCGGGLVVLAWNVAWGRGDTLKLSWAEANLKKPCCFV